MTRQHHDTHQVRIIGGMYRRTPLAVIDRPGLRPTPDRVRETLFNWLGQDLRGWRCLDAFAGSGALGFEAASRGAASVIMIERDPQAFAQVQRMRTRLAAGGVTLVKGDALVQLQQMEPASLDVVFLDPPFDSAVWDAALAGAARAVTATGWVYLESPECWSGERLRPFGLETHRDLKAGAVHAHLLRHRQAGLG